MDYNEGFESLDRDIRIAQLEVFMNACYDEQEIEEYGIDIIEQQALLEMPSIEYYYNPNLLEVMNTITEEEMKNEYNTSDSLDKQMLDFLEEQRKYDEALTKQIKSRKIIFLDVPLTKEEIIDHFFEMIELYMTMYNLPKINISDHNWDVFLNSIYDVLSVNKKLEFFQEIIEAITKRVFAKALVKELNSIELDYLIYYINFLDEYDIDKKDIESIIDRIEKKRDRAKIIVFSPVK